MLKIISILCLFSTSVFAENYVWCPVNNSNGSVDVNHCQSTKASCEFWEMNKQSYTCVYMPKPK